MESRIPGKSGMLSSTRVWQVVGAEQVRISRVATSVTPRETQNRGFATVSFRSATAAAFAVAMVAARRVMVEKRMMISDHGNSTSEWDLLSLR